MRNLANDHSNPLAVEMAQGIIRWRSGSFSVIEKSARNGRNPKTGETIQIAARKAVKFKAYKALNDAISQ